MRQLSAVLALAAACSAVRRAPAGGACGTARLPHCVRTASIAASSARASPRAAAAAADADAAGWQPGDIMLEEPAAAAGRTGLASIDPPGWFNSLLAAAPPLALSVDGLGALRGAGAAELRALVEADGLPVSKSEAWRHIGVRDLYRRELASAPSAVGLPPAALPAAFAADAASAIAVFVDGAFAPELSRTDGLPAGVYVGGLAGLDPARRVAVLPKLAVRIEADNGNTLGTSDGSVAGALGGGPFCALNAAAAVDVAFVLVPAGTVVAEDAPVHLVFVSTGAAPASHPRYLVDASAGASFSLVTSHVDAADLAAGSMAEAASAAAAGAVSRSAPTGSASASRALTNAVGQVLLADGAVVRHTLVAERGPGSSHVENVEADCAQDARYELCTLQAPAFACRINVGATLGGKGAQAHARGLMVSGGAEPSAVDLHTAIRHLTEGCTSSQLQKALLAQKGRAVFRGLIRANGLAMRTVAHQLSRSMLLSDGAKLDASPCLEIIADDVECTHGATVAELDEEKVFYFRARGISAEAARFALVKGFALEVIDAVPYSGAKARIAAAALSLIPRKADRAPVDTTGWSSI